jgi:hypothetical protein
MDVPISTIVTLAVSLAALSLLVAHVTARLIQARTLLIGTVLGLLPHPVLDVFIGSPPDLLYPLPLSLIQSRVVLVASDSTLNFMVVFLIELVITLFAFQLLVSRTPESDSFTPIALLPGLLGVPLYFVLDTSPTIMEPHVFTLAVFTLGLCGAALGASMSTKHRSLPQISVNSGLGVGTAIVSFTLTYSLANFI